MKAVKSKAQERLEIERQIDHYLQHGGKVHCVEPGVSGREMGVYQKISPVTFRQSPAPRTPLVEEVRAIEARRKRSGAPLKARPKGPRRVLIKDDFGEPLRWSWRDA